MEKIIVVIDPRNFKPADIGYACSIATLTQSHLTGLFVEEQNFELIPAPEDTDSGETGDSTEPGQVAVLNTGQGIRFFSEICRKKNISFDTCHGKGNPVEEVVYESRFADLLILDPEISFGKKAENVPTHFVKEVLEKTECPVILSPNLQEDINEIFFCYDAGKSSVFAIKQFTYILPHFRNKKIVLTEINPSAGDAYNEGHKHMMNWLKMHFTSVDFQTLDGDVEEEMFKYFYLKRNILIVMGAYGRGMLSYFFKHSTADKLVRNLDVPVFISHY